MLPPADGRSRIDQQDVWQTLPMLIDSVDVAPSPRDLRQATCHKLAGPLHQLNITTARATNGQTLHMPVNWWMAIVLAC